MTITNFVTSSLGTYVVRLSQPNAPSSETKDFITETHSEAQLTKSLYEQISEWPAALHHSRIPLPVQVVLLLSHTFY